MSNRASRMGTCARGLCLASLFLLILTGAGPVQALHFEKVSEDTQRIAPQLQQGEPGGPQISVGGDQQATFATFTANITQANDCGVSCDNSDCSTTPMNVLCTNLADLTFMIAPDPGETVGDPVAVCLTHSYEMSVTSTGSYAGYGATGGNPTVTVDPTLVIRTPGGVEFSNGPVQITTGTQSDQFFRTFGAHIGDTIEMSMGNEVKGGGTGIGSFRGLTSAELAVFSCPPLPAPALSKWATVSLILVLMGCGGLSIRRRWTRRTPS